jgi:hypothetical protein
MDRNLLLASVNLADYMLRQGDIQCEALKLVFSFLELHQCRAGLTNQIGRLPESNERRKLCRDLAATEQKHGEAMKDLKHVVDILQDRPGTIERLARLPDSDEWRKLEHLHK